MKNIQVLKPYYRTSEILEYIKECCDTSWTGIGGKMIDFEEAWKAYSGAKTCHMLNSATSGLHLALYQLKEKYKWDDNNEVITTSLTFVSTNHAILYSNLLPVFADVDQYGCLDPDSIISKISSSTKAVLYVGLGGNVGNLNKIKKICKDHNLKLILDAAHMSGTKWIDSGKQVGCDEEGIDVSIFSGQAVKNLPTFDSGWICWNGSDAEEMDKKSRQLCWLGINKDTFSRSTSQGTYKWHYDVPDVGFKYHGNAIAGAFGLVGLKYLEKDNCYRRYLCDIYSSNLKGFVEFVPSSDECLSSRHLIQILVDKRDEVMLALNQLGVFPGVHYRINTLYPMYGNQTASTGLVNSESFSERTISLPLHMHMTVDDVLYVCESLKKVV